MDLVRLAFRSDRGGGIRRWVGAIVVLALAGAAALTAATAARRTDTAFARALSSAHAADVYVSINAIGSGPAAAKVLDALDHSAVVAAAGRYGGATLAVVRRGRLEARYNTGTATAYLPFDRRAGTTISRFRVLHGRSADPDRADEVVVNQAFVRSTGARVGQTIPGLRMFTLTDVDTEGNPDPHKGTAVTLRIVGIVKTPDEALAPAPLRIFTTPALTRRFTNAPYYYQDLLVLKRGGADLHRLTDTISRIQKQFPTAQIFVSPLRDGMNTANRAADPLVNALWILSILALAIGLLLAGQAFARVLSTGVGDNAVFRVVGFTHRQRLRYELASVVFALALASVIAVLLAWLCSPFTPVGAARAAEPHPGFVLHAGFALAAITLIVVGGLAAVLPTAIRVAWSAAPPGSALVSDRRRPSSVARAVANAGLGVPAAVGTQLAFEPGRGSTATPVASVLASLALIVTTVTGTVAFGANLDRLVTTKRLYGWNWDAAVGTSFGAIPNETIGPARHVSGVRAIAGLAIGRLTIDHHDIPAVGIDPIVGTVAPTIDAGRLPRTKNEIALGAKTLRSVHTHVDDFVNAVIDGHTWRLHVVGIATFPAFGTAAFTEAGLGTGAIGTATLFPPNDPQTPGGRFNYLLLRYGKRGATTAEIAGLTRLMRSLGCVDQTCVLTDLRPNEIDGIRGARNVPLVVGLVLALLLVATLTHTLLSTMRRRRGDLAVLRALGCSRRQLESILRWQTLMLTAAALAVGIPLGLVASRFVWTAFTQRLGIAPGTIVPAELIALGSMAILALGFVLATTVGVRAPNYARERPFVG